MFRVLGKSDGTSKKFGLSFSSAKHMKSDGSYSRHYGSFEKCTGALAADSQTLKTTREINNPIAYNLNSWNLMDWLDLMTLKLIFVFKSPYLSFSTVVSSQSVDLRLRFLLKTTISQNYGLQRAYNWLNLKVWTVNWLSRLMKTL